MKKFIYLAIVAAVFMMQGCFNTESVEKLRASMAEEQEILDGKVFQIPAATITYSDGTFFAFKEYGQYQYIEDDSEIEIVTPNYVYECSKYDKTYTQEEFQSPILYDCDFLFPLAYLRYINSLEVFDGDIVDMVESTMTVAGKMCVSFTDNVENATVAGWNRIFLYDEDEDGVIQALTIVESAEDRYFQIPQGYTLAE